VARLAPKPDVPAIIAPIAPQTSGLAPLPLDPDLMIPRGSLGARIN